MHFNKDLRVETLFLYLFHFVSRMSDLMWGGVPFQIPSITAMKYLGKAVKVKVSTCLLLHF